MQKKAKLKDEERKFFSLVIKSIYMNPFCDERLDVLCRILPRFMQERNIAPELNERISPLDNRGYDSMQHFDSEDSLIMMQVYLYQEFVRLIIDTDIIRSQFH